MTEQEQQKLSTPNPTIIPLEPEAIEPEPPRPQTEGEMVIELLRSFQQDLKAMQEQYKLLQAQISNLDTKVNKEMPQQLDAAFGQVRDNFVAIAKSIETMHQPQTALAAASQNKEGGGVMDMIGGIVKQVMGEETGSSGTLSDFDKEILKTSKQIQLLSLRDMLKKTAKSAGVELSDHIVVNP